MTLSASRSGLRHRAVSRTSSAQLLDALGAAMRFPTIADLGLSSHRVWGLARHDEEWSEAIDEMLRTTRDIQLRHGTPAAYPRRMRVHGVPRLPPSRDPRLLDQLLNPPCANAGRHLVAASAAFAHRHRSAASRAQLPLRSSGIARSMLPVLVSQPRLGCRSSSDATRPSVERSANACVPHHGRLLRDDARRLDPIAVVRLE